MRLEETEVAMVMKAVDVYLRIAWGDRADEQRRRFDFSSVSTIGEALERFEDERKAGKQLRKYALRLGNPRYRNMKLLFQELLVRDKFFFAVDTHDEVFVDSSWSNFDQWISLKQQNSDLKEQIEREWEKEGIPTIVSVVQEIEQETRLAQAPKGHGDLVLIVDDDTGIASGVEVVLNRQGYRTLKAQRAEEARKMIAETPPDLILSDLEMPGMSGLDLARSLRSDPATKSIPFILATAASIDASHFSLIDGYLVKPFETTVLLKFIAKYLSRKKPE
jgi:CheY-like chemotaxis protein